jgi:mannosyltransferase
MSTETLPTVTVTPRSARRLRVRDLIGPRANIRYLAVELGTLAWFVTFLGSWRPSYWGDEAASILSAERPLATLWPELGRVDAVHGTYYLFLHFWIDLFGASELSTRFPSTIAVGIAAAGIVLLGARLFGRRVGVVAAIVFAVLPRVSYFGAETRSYAIGTAVAVWLTIVFVALIRRRVTKLLPWIGFGLFFAVAVYVFLYLALLAVVYSLVLLVTPRPRLLLKRFVAAGVLAVLVAAPVLFFGLSQHGQISFLAHRNYVTFHRLIVVQWFGNPWLALVGWALIVVAIVALAARLRLAGRNRLHHSGLRNRMMLPVVLVVGWLVLPMLILFLGNAFVAPMYTIRYLSFVTPAVALLVAVGTDAVARRLVAVPGLRVAPFVVPVLVPVLAVALVAGLAAPTDVFQRSDFAKDGGSDWRQASAVLAANATPGDDVVFDETAKASRKPRLAEYLYPADFAGLVDVTLATPHAQRAGLWDTVHPLAAVSGRLTSRVWDLEYGTDRANVLELERLGYSVEQAMPVHRTVIYELVRE